ncbi:hypothetical protein TFLX_06642 [Thermoflexales bacterium]|nr:hypothetical protein TFLX_06642 [Thermoflexales bacterium]
MRQPRSDATRVDVLNRLACVRGHLNATRYMVERDDRDLVVAQQLYAVRGALAQIQIRLLRAWLSEWPRPTDDVQQIERDLPKIFKKRRQRGNNSRHGSGMRDDDSQVRR